MRRAGQLINVSSRDKSHNNTLAVYHTCATLASVARHGGHHAAHHLLLARLHLGRLLAEPRHPRSVPPPPCRRPATTTNRGLQLPSLSSRHGSRPRPACARRRSPCSTCSPPSGTG